MKAMLRTSIVIGILFLTTNLTLADEFTFRKTKWGMSAAEVKASEPLEVNEKAANMLAYKTKVIGKDVFLGYIFIDDQLVRARYVLSESHSNKSDFIKDYNDFKKILEKKYGPPKLDKTRWKNDLYKDDPSHWGMAISMGHLVYFSIWETSSTKISSILSGDNFKINCGVDFRSKKLEALEKKAEEKKALDAF